MVTYNEYLKSILNKILESYADLTQMSDKPGDLEIIKKELLKINGFAKVILNKIDENKISSSDFRPLKLKLEHYMDNYFFVQEIETMSSLYSNDASRVKNMRLKIIEAFNDKNLIDSIEDLSEKI